MQKLLSKLEMPYTFVKNYNVDPLLFYHGTMWSKRMFETLNTDDTIYTYYDVSTENTNFQL